MNASASPGSRPRGGHPRRWRGHLALLVAALGAAACAGVLGLERRRSDERPFEHRQHVEVGVSCNRCHAGAGSAGETGPLHLPSTAACVECHQAPHDARACDGCHGQAWVRTGAALARQHLRFEHAAHLRAVKGDCVRCHQEVGRADASVLRPGMASCFGCHEQQDQWALRDCQGCHVDLPDERVVPASHVVHDGDWLRRHGIAAAGAADLCATCHTESTCAACHGRTVAALPARRAFDRPTLDALHPAGFRARHAEAARLEAGLCTTCHTEQSCRDCHARQGVDAPSRRSPHPAGFLTAGRGGGTHGREARLDPASCAACHGGAGERLCVDCHRVGGPGGSPHGPGFTSALSPTRDLPCRLCHGGPP